MDIETETTIDSIIIQLQNFTVTKDESDRIEIEGILDDYRKKDHIFEPMTENVLKILYTILILSGIITNIVIISVIASNKKLMTTSNLLLINLFVSDLLLCIFCMPFTLIALIRRGWSFGAFLCKLVPFIQAVTTFVSAITISSIAFDRMVQITANQFTGKRNSYRANPSPLLIKYNTIIIWIISLLLASPICLFQELEEFGIKEYNISYEKCIEKWPNNNRGIYSFVILITQLLIPSSVMLVSHYRIRAHLHSHRLRRIHRGFNEKQDSSNPSIRSNGTNNEYNQRETMVIEEPPTTSSAVVVTCFPSPTSDPSFFDKELHRNNRITIFLLTVTIIFGISWLPWNLFNVYVDFYPDINLTPSDLYLILGICHTIAMSSATTNAIFYGFLHTAIRKELRNIILKLKRHF